MIFSRDNRTYLKISGIEQLTKLWEPSTQRGMQLPHDIQQVNLDSNLTMPDKSLKHIHEILNAHARYCGLPNIDFLCAKDVLLRLVWISAGVPRDALYIFMQALSRATVKDQKRVSITSMNAVASEMVDNTLKDIEKDAPDEHQELKNVLEGIRKFCLKKLDRKNKDTNAFRVEQKHDHDLYQQILKLVESRFLHLLHDGITPSEAGHRFTALLLDFGFYEGSRTARAVQLFHKDLDQQFTVKELRKLPIFPLE